MWVATDSDPEGLEVQFLRQNDKLGFVYRLPMKEDKSWVSKHQVDQKAQCLVWIIGGDSTKPDVIKLL